MIISKLVREKILKYSLYSSTFHQRGDGGEAGEIRGVKEIFVSKVPVQGPSEVPSSRSDHGQTTRWGDGRTRGCKRS